ncbi:MAG TPA: DUF87 domain-containing protein [Thermoleophilaceae bacterium]|nr:DUF87 domain-containing protein [Thermoleophilaceae bacterium]
MIFVTLGLIGTDTIGDPPWLSVGIGMALSATFMEPYFAGPRAAVVNGAAGALAVQSTARAPVETLWWILLIFFLIVALAGLAASITPPGATNRVTKNFASRFGSATIVGGTVLLLCVLVNAEQDKGNFELLLIGSGVLVAAISVDWVRIFSAVRSASTAATAVAAIGPRMLLVAGAPADMGAGTTVALGSSFGDAIGTVIARLPHGDGPRHQIGLVSDSMDLCSQFPCDIVVTPQPASDTLAGAVGQGSTEHTLEFEPVCALPVGSPVSIRVDDQPVLYQVVRSKLVDASWAGAHAVVPHATARLVGWPEGERLSGGTHLPHAHEPVYKSGDLAGALPEGFHEVGVLKGTSIPIGLRLDGGRQGHIAVLGMSGMGKTVAATRICEAFGQQHVVIGLDTTGEYASRLGFPAWDGQDFNTTGHFVYEPAGPPPTKAAEFIRKCMDAGSTEYRANETPVPRVVVLEEAHSFVPEFPLALREHQKPISESTRYIMQSRKFGITFLIVSQRTAVVSKTALSQCENYVILKTLDKTSLEYLESVVGPEVRDAIPTLRRYEAVCVGPAFNTDEPVIVSLKGRTAEAGPTDASPTTV